LPICWTAFSVRPCGMPMDASMAVGLTPLAAKSLMFITTALRAACQRLMPCCTSVFPTSMSAFRTASLLSPISRAETSSPKGTGMFGIWSRHSRIMLIISRSPSSSAAVSGETSVINCDLLKNVRSVSTSSGDRERYLSSRESLDTDLNLLK